VFKWGLNWDQMSGDYSVGVYSIVDGIYGIIDLPTPPAKEEK
jgi:hypothetical protein